ncbi:DUF58 domain-containing protein [Halobacteriales archaeon QH_10_67_22]|nr:MAG: DUF58 domain-containing protein [Halobacteriales archaeon QH_10_67_22]
MSDATPDGGTVGEGDAGERVVSVEPTTRWRGGVAAALVFLVAGVVAQRATLLLAAVVPLAYLAFSSASGARMPELRAKRQVEPDVVPPGIVVAVGLEIRNESDSHVADLRVVDGAPRDLAVTGGTPRAGTALAPGETCTVEYTMVARRGRHRFDDPEVRVRGVGGGAVARATLPVEGDTELDCRLDATAPPLADHGSGFVGQMTTDDPGRGLAFHSTREYRHGDAADRIDWRSYAKRNELATVNYERRVSTAVVVVLDARDPCRVVSGPGRPSAVELGGYAATHAVTSLLDAGHEVGVAVLGLEGPGPAGLHWLPPGTGPQTRARALELFERASDRDPRDVLGSPDEAAVKSDSLDAGVSEIGIPTPGRAPGEESDPSAGGTPRAERASPADVVDATAQVRKVDALAPRGVQLALFSPLLDDAAVEAVESWQARDRPVVVLSPDIVSSNTVSGQFEQIRRRDRLARCQDAGARAFDWQRGTPLPLALEYAFTAQARSGATTARPDTGGGI